MTEFQHLFSPIQIGSARIPNRIVSTAHNVGLTQCDLPDDRMVCYYREKAKGGSGLIVMGAAHVHPSSPAAAGHVRNQADDIIPWYSRIADAVHTHRSKILAQLSHMGRLVEPSGESPVVAPSALRAERFLNMPKNLEPEEIEDITYAFGQAARRAKDGGLDGVELQGAHGYLIMAFMSPLTNLRNDRYGGSLENRLRFALEVIEAVRAQVGRGFVLGMRLSGDEWVDGGLTLDDMQVIAKRLDQDGQLDYLSISASNHGYPLGWALAMGPSGTPLGNLVHLASGIRAVVSLPIICVGRINDPAQAEQILADGHADMIGMARATIADPELPEKARLGRLDDIRPCVGDGHCDESRAKRQPVRCIHNPLVGRESEWAELETASVRKKVLVAGGGPAGLEAARVAALRGHSVILCERQAELGGQVMLCSRLPTRGELAEIVFYLGSQLGKLGVEIRLQTEITPCLVQELEPDVVVLATGSRPLPGEFPGAQQSNVATYWDVLEGRVQLSSNVVILDDDHGYAAPGIAELLADQGKRVELLTKSLYVGQEINGKARVLLYWRLFSKGVTLTPHTWIRQVRGQTLQVYNVYSQEEREITGVDNIILSLGGQADEGLYHALKGSPAKLYRVGDCVAPRRIHHAVLEGHRVGRQI